MRWSCLLLAAGCAHVEPPARPATLIPDLTYQEDRDPSGTIQVERARLWIEGYKQRWQLTFRNHALRPITVRFCVKFIDEQARILNFQDESLKLIEVPGDQTASVFGSCDFVAARYLAVKFPR